MVGAYWLVSVALAGDPTVLMLGNSYTQVGDLQAVTADALGASVPGDVEFGAVRLTAGGLQFVDHLARVRGEQQGDENPWREALVTGDDVWDVVILQEQSQIPGFPSTEGMYIASRDAAAGLDEAIAARDADTVFMATWGRRDGDAQNASMYPDFHTMNDRILDGYLAYAGDSRAAGRRVTVAPVGTAFAAIYAVDVAAGRDPLGAEGLFASLYSPDGSHPSPVGTMLAAWTLVAALNGREVAGAPLESPSVDADLLVVLQTAADAAVFGDAASDVFGAVPYRWAWDWADWSGDIDGAVVRPHVQLGIAADAGASLTVGGEGEGVLVVADGGALTAESLIVGSGADGWGLIVVDGGEITVDSVVGGSGQGHAEVTTGTLEISGTSTGLASVIVGEEGTLVLHPTSESAALAVVDAVTLDGRIVVTDAPSVESVVLVQAAVITGAAEADLPEGWTTAVTTLDGGEQALLMLGPDAAAPVAKTKAAPADDCGCATGAGPFGWLSLPFVLLALVVRRRSSPS
jgi:hypothetical protein